MPICGQGGQGLRLMIVLTLQGHLNAKPGRLKSVRCRAVVSLFVDDNSFGSGVISGLEQQKDTSMKIQTHAS